MAESTRDLAAVILVGSRGLEESTDPMVGEGSEKSESEWWVGEKARS